MLVSIQEEIIFPDVVSEIARGIAYRNDDDLTEYFVIFRVPLRSLECGSTPAAWVLLSRCVALSTSQTAVQYVWRA